ncbi:MAG: signal peptidase II [Oscillospiraceae bacterium]|nr:signal peptidase II [Oscillospiraceae bacterium]
MKKLSIGRIKLIIILSTLVLIGIDQLIKFAVVSNMQLYDTIPVINNVLHITYVLNDGAAFSMMSGQSWLLCGVTSVLMIGLVVYFFSKSMTHIPTLCSLGLIISGGIGNLIDRFFRGEALFQGKVVDFVDFRLINFAVFNFADCCVVIGTCLLMAICIYLMYKEYKEKKKKSEVAANE